MSWAWPQIVVAVWLAFCVFTGIYMNGKPKTGTWDGAWSITITMISALVLWAGGFWS